MNKLFLTRSETLRVNAYREYKPRELSKTEKALWHLVNVSKMKPGAEKDAEISETIKFMKGNDVRDFIIDRANQCANDPAELDKLLEAYPHVKYGDVIGKFESLSAIERIQLNSHYPVYVHNMEPIAEWIIKAHIFFNMVDTYIPSGVETFIPTPGTDYDHHRRLWLSTKDNKHLGYVLPKVLQAEVNAMFGYGIGGLGRSLNALIQARAYDIPDLFRRVGLEEAYEKAKCPGLEIIYPTSFEGTYMELVKVSFVHKEHGNIFHFQL